MPAHTETLIQRLCAKALAAKTPEDIERVVNELRSALEEHVVMAKDSLEGQVSNFALLDAVARKSSSAE
jgi:hypothetical protein